VKKGTSCLTDEAVHSGLCQV